MVKHNAPVPLYIQIKDHIRLNIEQGVYSVDEKIPSERQLAEQFGVNRLTVSKAIHALAQDGLVYSRVGKGTFVAGYAEIDGLGSIANLSRQLTPVRMMRARLCIEPAIAREAAINASSEAITRIKLARDRAQAAASWSKYEACDDLFHKSIAEASDNALLVSLFDHLNTVRRAVTWASVIRRTERPSQAHLSFAEHHQIADAIETRDPAAAHDAMRKHIGSVSARLFGEV